MLFFLTVVIIGIIVYAFWREGVLTAFAMTCNIFIAGLVAFNFFEPLADQVDPLVTGSFLAGYEDGLCLLLLFCLTLALLRVVTNNLANRVLEYHPALQQAGSVVCAVVAGYLVAGFLLCLVQTLPLPEKFLGFEPGIDPSNHGGIRRVMPPDRVWLALMSRASQGPFAWGENNLFDRDGSFELRYARLRRIRDRQENAGK